MQPTARALVVVGLAVALAVPWALAFGDWWETGATLPLTTSLAGVTVTIQDSASATHAALLYGAFASTGQVNFVIPSGTAKGAAKVTVTAPSGTQTAPITISDGAPGLFTANQNGRGVPTGQIVLVHADGSHTVENLATLSGGTYVATTIKLASTTDQVFLQLYGTGIRHASKVTAAVSGTPAAILYAGQQGAYPGLDQVNLQLPKTLQASGALNIPHRVTGPGQRAPVGAAGRRCGDHRPGRPGRHGPHRRLPHGRDLGHDPRRVVWRASCVVATGRLKPTHQTFTIRLHSRNDTRPPSSVPSVPGERGPLWDRFRCQTTSAPPTATPI